MDLRVCNVRERERGCGEGIRGLLVNEAGISTVGLNGEITFQPLDVLIRDMHYTI